MDDKDIETLENTEHVDPIETTKEVITLKDLSLEAIANMEKLYQDDFDQSLEEANQIFEEKIETLNEEDGPYLESIDEEDASVEKQENSPGTLNEEPKKDNVFKKIKKKWDNLSKRNKILLILGFIIILLLLVFLLYFLFTSNKEADVPPTKEPDVILEMDYYRYENGKLVFLDGKNELGTYECENKDEKLCKLALLTSDDVMDTIRKVSEDNKPLELQVPIYHQRFAFVIDNNKEDTKEIKVYDIEN